MNPDPNQPQTPAPVENPTPEVPTTPVPEAYAAAPVVADVPATPNPFGGTPVSSEPTVASPAAQPVVTADPLLNVQPAPITASKPKSTKLILLIAVVVVLVVVAVVMFVVLK